MLIIWCMCRLKAGARKADISAGKYYEVYTSKRSGEPMIVYEYIHTLSHSLGYRSKLTPRRPSPPMFVVNSFLPFTSKNQCH